MKKDMSKQFWQILLIVLFLFFVGATLLAKTIIEYRQYDISTQDKALELTMNSVDSTLTELSKRYLSELQYVTGRRGFLQAEEDWLSTGEAKDLLSRLQENLLGENESFETILAVMNGQVILSTNGKRDYWIPVYKESNEEMEITVCTDESLKPYIAFVQHKKDISYAALMDPVIFYEKIEENSGLKVMGDMILMDKDHSMFMYRDENDIVVKLLDDEGKMENPLLHILLYAQMKETESIDFYEVKEGPYKEAYRARVAICPEILSENKYFSVGILHNEDVQTEMMQITAIKILFFGGMIVLGIVILLFYLRWIYRQDARNRKEIEILLEKKEAMEALNIQTKELAHHQRLETIGQLTSGVAHEFNNLLTPIMGYSIMTLENLPAEDTESYDNLIEIYEAAKKAKELISRLSDLSRKNTAVTMRYINPNEMVKKALAMVNAGKPKQIDVITDLKCREVMIYGNETQLSQMILNLVLNAIHAIGDEAGQVIIRDYSENDHIIFQIEDTGKGMSEEVKEKIFEPFFTTKEMGRGTGLGLAIVMQIVEEHNATITVDSVEGEGSTFTISFPIVSFED